LPEFVKKGLHIYHKTFIENLKSIGVVQNNNNNH